MKNQNYNSVINVGVDAAETFKQLGNVSEWWTANIEGNSKKTGDIFTVHFNETYVTFEVIELIQNKKVVWLVTDCFLHWLTDKKEWNGTKIVFEIDQTNNTTRLSMSHIGLVPGIECYESCKVGWDHYINESLLKLITEGKGIPERAKAIQ